MFDAAKFLSDNFKDASGVAGSLASYMLPSPPIDTIRKWFERNVVPASWLPVLVVAIELENGRPTSMAQYLVAGSDA